MQLVASRMGQKIGGVLTSGSNCNGNEPGRDEDPEHMNEDQKRGWKKQWRAKLDRVRSQEESKIDDYRNANGI